MNQLYGKARQSILEAGIAFLTDNIKAVLVNIAGGHYVVSIDVDQYLSAIASGDRVAISGNLASKTSTLGVADAADITFTAVTGAVCGAIVIYKDTGDPATSPLIAYLDSATGLPVLSNGGDIVLQFSNDVSKIFKL